MILLFRPVIILAQELLDLLGLKFEVRSHAIGDGTDAFPSEKFSDEVKHDDSVVVVVVGWTIGSIGKIDTTVNLTTAMSWSDQRLCYQLN